LATHVEAGSCSEQKFQECLKSAQKASESIFKFYRETVERKFSKELA
jgi:ribonuclease PH